MAVAAMRAPYRIPHAAKGEYAREYRLLCAWAVKAKGSDKSEIMRACGLTWAGSPPNVMDSIYVMGERQAEDVTGYAQEIPPPRDEEVAAVDEFMEHLQGIVPGAHAALLARHRRLVYGEYQHIRSEVGMAMALYGTQRAAAQAMLSKWCDKGYTSLRLWFEHRNGGLVKTG